MRTQTNTNHAPANIFVTTPWALIVPGPAPPGGAPPPAATPDLPEPTVVTDAFVVDLAAKKVTRDGADVHLTPTEWSMLEMLVRHRGKLVGQRELLTEIWGPSYVGQTHYLRVYLTQLRHKLEPDPSRPRYLITEPGRGYRFEP